MRTPASGGRRASRIEASMNGYATSCRCGDGDRQLPNCTRDLTKCAGQPGRRIPLQEHDAAKGRKALCRDHGQRQRGDAMDQDTLVSEQIDAAAKFLEEFQKYLPVESAFWLRGEDDGV